MSVAIQHKRNGGRAIVDEKLGAALIKQGTHVPVFGEAESRVDIVKGRDKRRTKKAGG